MSLSRVILECYGTANYPILEPVFAPIILQADVWAKASFTKQHFVHHGVTMFYLMDALCNQIEFQVVETIFHRLELERIVEPYGIFETLLILIVVGRCVHSYRDMVQIVRSCETAREDQDIFVGRCTQAHFLLPRLEFARTLIIYDFAYDVLAQVFAKPKPRPSPLKKNDQKQQLRQTKKRSLPKTSKLFLGISMRVAFFCAKLRHRQKAQRIKSAWRSVVLATIFAHRLKDRACQTRFRMERKLRKQVRKKALREEISKQNDVRGFMRRFVLPDLVHRIKDTKRKQIRWIWSFLCIVVRIIARFKRRKRQRSCDAVKIHISSHSIAGIINYWRKLAKVQRITQVILADKAVLDVLPLKLVKIREAIVERKVQTFLFSQPNTRGNRMYWEFRFAMHYLRIMHESILRILLHLQTRATIDALPRCTTQFSALMGVVLNPFTEQSAQITTSIVGQNSTQPMIKLLHHLQQGKFLKQFQQWLHNDPALESYDTCLSFFVLTLDIFENLEKCIQKIPFACDKMLHALYHIGSNRLNADGITVFYECAKHYPRFVGLFGLFKQRSISNFIDCWMKDSYEFDLLDFLRSIENSALFVDAIEKDKNTNSTTRKQKQVVIIKNDESKIELQKKFMLRKEALRHR